MHGDKKVVDGVEYVWSDFAIDYSDGIDLFDPITELWYSEDEAQHLDDMVQSRLVIRARKHGAWVKAH